MGTRKILTLAAVFTFTTMLASAASAENLQNQWTSAGSDVNNTRFQKNTSITVKKVSDLQLKWKFTAGGDVSATPSVDKDNVYFPDWGGNLNAVNRATGAVIWQKKISDYTGLVGDATQYITPDIARNTPVIADDTLIFGDQAGYHGGMAGSVIAVNKHTGELLWKTSVGSFFTIITQSPVVYGDTVYIGTASSEEAFEGLIPNYPCCSFRGQVLALDVKTGAIKWTTYMAPEGYSGNSVWGSTPVVDSKRNSLYVTTGNNYSVPADVQNCFAAAGSDTAAVQACVATISPQNFTDAIVSLDLTTGAVKWATSGIPFDSFNVDCFPDLLPPGYIVNPQNCPPPAGPDYDFGQGAMLYSVKGVDIVGAGQKSGQFWALSPDNGKVIWMTQAAPGGVGGGLQWGSSTDGNNIYFASANTLHKPWIVNGNTITYGFWGALDAATGKVLWQTADPQGAGDSAPVASVNGVVFACSMDAQGHMYAMDSSNGKIMWSYPSGGSCLSGAAIVGNDVYWGSGYSNFGAGTPSNQFYAFTVQ